MTTTTTRPLAGFSAAMSSDTAVPLPSRAQLLAQRAGAPAPVTASTDPDEVVEDGDDTVVEASRPVTPARPGRPVARAARPVHPGEVVQAMIRAQRGDTAAARLLEAAAGDLSTETAAGVVPPQHAERILGDASTPRRLFDHAVAHETLWSTGMKLEIPRLEADVEGGWIAEGGVLPTNDVTIGLDETAVRMWAHAARMSFSVVDRSSPAFVATYYRRTAEAYHRAVEALIRDTVAGSAAAFAGAAAAPTPAVVFDMAAQLLEESHAAGEEANIDTILAASDVWAALGGTTAMQGPAFASGDLPASAQGGALAGLRLVPVPGLGKGRIYVGDRRAIRLYGGDNASTKLQALVVGVAQVQHGVYAECAIHAERAGWIGHTFGAARAASK